MGIIPLREKYNSACILISSLVKGRKRKADFVSYTLLELALIWQNKQKMTTLKT